MKSHSNTIYRLINYPSSIWFQFEHLQRRLLLSREIICNLFTTCYQKTHIAQQFSFKFKYYSNSHTKTMHHCPIDRSGSWCNTHQRTMLHNVGALPSLLLLSFECCSASRFRLCSSEAKFKLKIKHFLWQSHDAKTTTYNTQLMLVYFMTQDETCLKAMCLTLKLVVDSSREFWFWFNTAFDCHVLAVVTRMRNSNTITQSIRLADKLVRC